MQERPQIIWDGERVRPVSASEAQMLEQKGEAQNLSELLRSGGKIKTSSQFPGYRTRELRAETTPVYVEAAPDTPLPSQGADINWRSYRAATAEHLGIEKITQVKKQQVLEYMREHGIATE